MSNPELDVVEFLLTTTLYTERRELDPDDLPAAYRAAFWSDGTIERPLSATTTTASEATGVERPWDAISGLMFTDRDDFSGSISFTDREMAEQWFLDRVDADRLERNPVLAAAYGDEIEGVDYETARAHNRPSRADRAFIDAMLEEAFDTDDEDDESMLDLVDVRAPRKSR